MIHKTKKEEGKKHITMPLRWEFRLFRLDSRPISAVFGLFRPFWSSADTTWYGRYDRILAELARFGANQAESAWIRGKKVAQMRHRRTSNRVSRRATSDSGAAPSQPLLCFLDQILFWIVVVMGRIIGARQLHCSQCTSNAVSSFYFNLFIFFNFWENANWTLKKKNFTTLHCFIKICTTLHCFKLSALHYFSSINDYWLKIGFLLFCR